MIGEVDYIAVKRNAMYQTKIVYFHKGGEYFIHPLELYTRRGRTPISSDELFKRRTNMVGLFIIDHFIPRNNQLQT